MQKIRKSLYGLIPLTMIAVFIATATVVSATDIPKAIGLHTPSHEPRVFLYDDGRHTSPLYQFAPPLEPEDFVFTVDQIVGSGVDTLIYSAGLEGGVVQYDSRLAQKWGDNVDVWTHSIFYRASRNLQQLIRDGFDPLELICQRCHQTGIWFIATLPVCITGADRKHHGLGRTSDFAYRTELQVGEDDDPRAKSIGRFFKEKRLNFIHPEVRQERFRLFEELLTQYESDGVELDFSIDNEFGPICRFNELEKLAPILTEWIRDLREVARRAEQEQGRRKRIYVRIPAASPKVWRSLGFEVQRWIDEDLVDGLICLTTNRISANPMLDQDLDLTAATEATAGSDCRVLAGFEGHLGSAQEEMATASMVWAAAANAYRRGADAFGICMGMWAPDGWPWVGDEYTTLRVLAHPDLLSTANKTYRALSSSGRSPVGLFPPTETLLPRPIAEGETLQVRLPIADKLNRRHKEGTVEMVRLRVHLTNLETGLDKVRVELNGEVLPESILTHGDLHFRVVNNGIAGPYGYLFDYHLSPDFYPLQGDNFVKVTLVKRDPKLNQTVNLHDVSCTIRYRVHRHFQRVPVDY